MNDALVNERSVLGAIEGLTTQARPAGRDSLSPSEKELFEATRPFASERRLRSIGHAVSSFGALLASVAAASFAPRWPLQLGAAVLSGLLIVRVFILYHDVLHGALLRGSRVARRIFDVYGFVVLAPPRVWRETHNYHHAHTAQLVGSHVGSFPMASVAMWRRMRPRQRMRYRAARHPLTIAFAYLTVFLYGMCLGPFLRQPRKNWDAGLALVVHGVLSAGLLLLGGPRVYFFGLLLPLAVAHALGAYLFYAQHNFPAVRVAPRETWRFAQAALQSSSYMPMGPVMRWFTGNIGYHHVHHLNPSIPFYRLPDAMAAIPALQHPGVTTLRLRDILACLRLDLWDPTAERMIDRPSREESPPR